MYFNHSFPSLVNEAAVSMAGVHQAVCPRDNANWLKCSVWNCHRLPQLSTFFLSFLPAWQSSSQWHFCYVLLVGCWCAVSRTGLWVWRFFFFLAHAKHHMQQPHAEVFENQIGRSGLQKLCFEACLQRVLSKKVFLLLIKEALSFSV